MRQLGSRSYGVRTWISVDEVGLASAIGSCDLQQTVAVFCPARQRATLVWDSVANDGASGDDRIGKVAQSIF